MFYIELLRGTSLTRRPRNSIQMGKHLANEIQCQQMRCPLLYQTIIIITTSIFTREPTIIQTVSEHLFLGIMLDCKLSFSSHIKYAYAKATKTFNFVNQKKLNL